MESYYSCCASGAHMDHTTIIQLPKAAQNSGRHDITQNSGDIFWILQLYKKFNPMQKWFLLCHRQHSHCPLRLGAFPERLSAWWPRANKRLGHAEVTGHMLSLVLAVWSEQGSSSSLLRSGAQCAWDNLTKRAYISFRGVGRWSRLPLAMNVADPKMYCGYSYSGFHSLCSWQL